MRFFSNTEIKIISLTVAAATVLAVVITVSIGLSKRDRSAPQTGQNGGRKLELPYITDIVIPEEFTLTGGERWYFSREPLKRWSQDQVDLFWIDPGKIGIDLMTEESNNVIKELVEEIP